MVNKSIEVSKFLSINKTKALLSGVNKNIVELQLIDTDTSSVYYESDKGINVRVSYDTARKLSKALNKLLKKEKTK